MADFLKTLTKRNTTKPGQPVQPDLVISGPQTFRTVRWPARCDLRAHSQQGIHVSFDNEKGFQVRDSTVDSPPLTLLPGPAKRRRREQGGRHRSRRTRWPQRGTHDLSALPMLISPQEDVPESLRLGAPSGGAKPAAAPAQRQSKKKGSGFAISGPTTFQHKLHVDEEYNWTGTDPTGAFRLLDKLGEGYAALQCLRRSNASAARTEVYIRLRRKMQTWCWRSRWFCSARTRYSLCPLEANSRVGVGRNSERDRHP